jgi:two-component system sensor histidine kinase KdpD
MFLGRGPAILASAGGALAFDVLFIAPRFSIAVADAQYLLTFAGFFLVGLIISTLMYGAQKQAASAQRREATAVELYELSRDLAAAATLDDIIDALLRHVSDTFNRNGAVLLPQGDKLMVHGLMRDYVLEPKDMAVADWAFKHGQTAGRGTATLSGAKVRCLPLMTVRGVAGVLAVDPSDDNLHLDPDQRRLMEAYASQAALAIERARLAEHTNEALPLAAPRLYEESAPQSTSP